MSSELSDSVQTAIYPYVRFDVLGLGWRLKRSSRCDRTADKVDAERVSLLATRIVPYVGDKQANVSPTTAARGDNTKSLLRVFCKWPGPDRKISRCGFHEVQGVFTTWT